MNFIFQLNGYILNMTYEVYMKLLTVIFLVFLMFSMASRADQCVKATPLLLTKGKAVFKSNCVTCHGQGGAGDGPAAQTLNPKPLNFKTGKFLEGSSLENVFKTVTSGVHNTSMTSFGTLSKEDRCAVSNYVLSLRRK
jgi:mono/diheme cytochrome c family protein